ncbi:hypothetical protein DICPUDRAFT_152249 [Dictyostelium purpureum]|uniref:Uncharacterized protein n=1 Tax=Dictyostelium purpureum TaxID=5786 RepID=F0ZKV4_DICPU|nr:uncharacterized protein DICPUDRAFT_152249 [Dictyostelium purpureum]EGC35425.1 hypothetical protein DICPUDRAFT_152249 [Dictyostelium purpureum]|eukprot:XP_003288038.1 hypothetical protein DICPUDRAFT_152249 [Dictyostelium purpureum]
MKLLYIILIVLLLVSIAIISNASIEGGEGELPNTFANNLNNEEEVVEHFLSNLIAGLIGGHQVVG